MSYKAGTAYIQVTPSFSGWETRVTSYIKTHTRPVQVPVEPEVDDKAARTELDALASKRDTTVQAKVDDTAAKTTLARLARTRTAKVRVNVDKNSLGQLDRVVGHLDNFFGLNKRTGAIAAGVAGGLPLLGPLLAPLAGGAAAIGSSALAGLGAGGIFGAALYGQASAMKKAEQNIVSLTKSLGTLQKGGDAYKAHAAALAQAQASFNKTFGAASTAFHGLQAAWGKFLSATSKVSLGVMAQGLTLLTNLLPRLAPIANAAGTAVSGLLTLFGKFLNGPEVTALLHFFTVFGPKAITAFGKILLNATKGILNLFMAFGPLSLQITGWLVDVTKKFAAWSQTVGKSQGFRDFIAFIKQNWPSVEGLVSGLVKFLGRLAIILAPAGSVLLKGLAAFAQWLGNLSTPALLLVATTIATLISPFAGVALAIASIGTAIGNLSRTSEPVARWVDSVKSKLSGLHDVLFGSPSKPGLTTTGLSTGNVSARGMGGAVGVLPSGTPSVGPSARAMGAPVVATTAQMGTAAGQSFVSKFEASLSSLGAKLAKAFAPLLPQLGQLVAPLVDVFTSFVSLVEQIWKEFGKNLIQFAVTFLSGVIEQVKGFLNILAGIFKLIRDVLTGNWSGAWSDIKQIAKGVGEVVYGLVKQWWAQIRLLFAVGAKVAVTLFSGLYEGIHNLLKAGNKYILDGLNATWDAIKAGFRSVKDTVSAIWSSMWDGLKTVAEAPIKFVIDTVLNGGLIKAFNWVVNRLGLKGLAIAPIPDPFAGTGLPPGGGGLQKRAGGGVLPGYTPGRDVHTFYSPTGGVLGLSGGEAVMVPEWTRAVGGRAAVDAMNRRARRGYSIGGVIGGIASAVTDPIGFLKGKVEGLLNNPLLASVLGQIVKAVPTKLLGYAVNKIKDLLASAASKVTGPLQHVGDVIGGVFGLGGGFGGFYQSVAKGMLGGYGWGSSQFPPLVALWNRESGWNPLARNPSSGAYGIPQALPASKMASAGADYLTNGVTQIRWGLGYIKGRYGSPAGAWLHEGRFGWYDQGGVANGTGWMFKGTPQPERVLSPQQTVAFDRLVSMRGNIRAELEGLTVMVGNPNDVARGVRATVRTGIGVQRTFDDRVGELSGAAN